MDEVIVCRSTEQIREDDLIEVQEWLTQDLNTMCCGTCLYTGKRREEMKALLAECINCILGGDYPRNLITRFLWAHNTSRDFR